jgi:hypothetical protein
MSDLRPSGIGQGHTQGQHTISRHPVAVPGKVKEKLTSGSGPSSAVNYDEDDDSEQDEDEGNGLSLSTASADSNPGPSNSASGQKSEPRPGEEGDDPNDLESLVNEYYYVGQKYDTLKTPSQRWVQNYFKNVLPNVVQSVRSRWSAVRKRAGLDSVLALPVVGGVAAALAGIAGLGMYAYRRRTIVETARKRRFRPTQIKSGLY